MRRSFVFFSPYKSASKQKTLLFQSRCNILPHILCSGFLASCHFMLQEYWMRPGPRWETCAGLLTGLLSCSLASMMSKARPNLTQPGPTQPSPVPAIFWHTVLANSWLVSICHEIIRIPQRCHSAVPLAVSIFNVGENKVLRSACIQPICCWWSNASASYVIPTNAN